MGEISIVHGRILIKKSKETKAFLDNYKFNKNFPFVTREMFNLGSPNHYYENPILNFGATYKNLDGATSLAEFIIKFENILKNIDFSNAKLELETEFMGEYHFFWGAKSKNNNGKQFYKKDGLIEFENWFFGLGYRHMFGMLLKSPKNQVPNDCEIPIKFNQKIKKEFNKMVDDLNGIEINSKRFFSCSHPVFGNNNVYLILTYLSLKNQLEFGLESNKGLFIKRLNNIEKVNTLYSPKYYKLN